MLAACGALAFASCASAAPVTQTTPSASSTSYWYGNGSAWQLLGSVALASGTNAILDLASTVTLVDQGWGGQASTNGVRVDLIENGVDLWGNYVAGATHSWSTQTYDLIADPFNLAALNAAVGSIDWATDPAVSIVMNATPWSYTGWELHTCNDVMSVISEAVPTPEPMSVLLFGTALAGMILIRRQRGHSPT